MDLASIQIEGRVAHKAGRSSSANPYVWASQWPSAMAETVEVWEAKIDAWDRGWQDEAYKAYIPVSRSHLLEDAELSQDPGRRSIKLVR